MMVKKQSKSTSQKDRATKQKPGASTLSVDEAKPENPFLRFHKFWLPGDAEEAPPAPEHFEQYVDLSIKNLADQSNDRWTDLDRVVWASTMATHLIRWLSSRAFYGDEAAQGQIADLARLASELFLGLARKEMPGVMPRIKNWPDMPGFISVVPEVAEQGVSLCKRIKQGEKYPFPLSQAGKLGKPLRITDAHHDLISRLHTHIDNYRASFQLLGELLEAFVEWQIHPLVRRMMKMPPLSRDTMAEWKNLGREILLDSTNQKPLEHSAFKPGGKYESLGTLDRRGEPNLWKRWREAWRLRAENMNRQMPEPTPIK